MVMKQNPIPAFMVMAHMEITPREPQHKKQASECEPLLVVKSGSLESVESEAL